MYISFRESSSKMPLGANYVLMIGSKFLAYLRQSFYNHEMDLGCKSLSLNPTRMYRLPKRLRAGT